MKKDLKKGEKEIKNAELTPIEDQYQDRDYVVDIELPEFTCVCPKTGYPDFAVIKVEYIPDNHIIELKSLKLYINKFRNKGIFHEEAVNKIMDDLIDKIDPKWIKVIGDFNRRGNVKTIVTAEHSKEGFERKEEN